LNILSTAKDMMNLRCTSAWYILGNVNAGGTVSFKPNNSEST